MRSKGQRLTSVCHSPLQDGEPGFAADCEQLYAAEQYEELLDKFVSALDAVLSASSSEQGAAAVAGASCCACERCRWPEAHSATHSHRCCADLECCLNMTCHLVPRIPLPGAVGAAQRLAAALASSTDSRPDKRLLALVTLYNAAYDASSKAAVLMQALGYAKQAGLADMMLPVIKAHGDGWAAELQLSSVEERQLYVACSDTLRACTRKPRTAARESYRLLTKCLTAYEVRTALRFPIASPSTPANTSLLQSPGLACAAVLWLGQQLGGQGIAAGCPP